MTRPRDNVDAANAEATVISVASDHVLGDLPMPEEAVSLALWVDGEVVWRADDLDPATACGTRDGAKCAVNGEYGTVRNTGHFPVAVTVP